MRSRRSIGPDLTGAHHLAPARDLGRDQRPEGLRRAGHGHRALGRQRGRHLGRRQGLVEPDLRDPTLAKLAKLAEREVLSFVYSRIQWAWTAGGLVAEDNWLAGPSAALPLAAKPPARKATRRAA